MDTAVSLDRLEKPVSVGSGDVVAWLDSTEESNGVDDASICLSVLDRSRKLVDSVWLASVDESPRLDVDSSAPVDRLSGLDILVSPGKLVGVGLSAVAEFETD